ncbi:CMGC/SRPK protein kinase [Sporothrix schenckii ATCC 58251]|uniref:non-specific serine/threonine protein kinase n=1 Tax=Sporothrix schenckii (strain ATCC 58251 / de Perez 2211183) TaxID=1391915 RepID=U7Q8D9_SPOS1|nr:CMGC/SRPK protein kinase [Sporothrix schenckii ATCC 58251]
MDIMPHEPLEKYVPGGFHPVSLGDALKDGRYTIRHKLGYGGQSTVWLAWDAHGPGAWVAIKIKSARASADGPGQDSEIVALQTLETYYCSIEKTQTQSQARSFIRVFDTFQHTGPNGVHNCIVTEVLGPTLADLLDEYRPDENTLPPDVVLRVSRQLLQGLDFTHHAGIAHGDVSPRNISFTCKNTQADGNDLFEMVGGEPPTAAYDDNNNTARPAGLPEQLVACTAWDGWYVDTVEDIRLIDWGWSFAAGKTVTVLGQPNNLRPPETFFEHSFTCKHDLWRAGCVIYSLFYQTSPFSCIGDPNHFFIRRQVAKLGPLPAPWHAKWEEMLVGYKYAEEDAANMPQELMEDTFEPRRQEIRTHILNADPDLGEDDNEYQRDEYSEYDVEALKCLLWPIQGLMRHEPNKRISLQEAASSIQWIDHRREATDDTNTMSVQ